MPAPDASADTAFGLPADTQRKAVLAVLAVYGPGAWSADRLLAARQGPSRI